MGKGLPLWAQADAPPDRDLLSREGLQAKLAALEDSPVSLVAVGDVLLADRARRTIAVHGAEYPFHCVQPLLQECQIVLANHEGPFTRQAPVESRRYVYRVDPELASTIADAGINVVTLANNHLFDCGPAGVLETIEAVDRAGLGRIGVGPGFVRGPFAPDPPGWRLARWADRLLFNRLRLEPALWRDQSPARGRYWN